MGFDTISQARKAQEEEVQRVRQIADAQMQKAGYSRSPAFTPQARPRTPYQPESERPLPATPPLVATGEEKPRTKRRSFGVSEGDQ